MRKVLKKLDENFEIYVGAFFLIGFSVFTIIQVFMRYIFKLPLAWSEELSRFLFIYFVFICTAYGIKKESHVRFSFFVNAMPNILKKVFRYISLLCLLGFIIFIDIYSIKVLLHIYESKQTSPALQVPFFWVYLSVPIGFCIMTVRIAQLIVQTIRKK